MPVIATQLRTAKFVTADVQSEGHYRISSQLPNPEMIASSPIYDRYELRMLSSSERHSAVGHLKIRTLTNPEQPNPDLQFWIESHGTAWLIEDNEIFTCAHNLYDASANAQHLKWATEVFFAPGYDFYNTENAVFKVVQAHIARDYTVDERRTPHTDVAVCRLERAVPNSVHIPIYDSQLEYELFESLEIDVIGYPGGISFDFGRQQWANRGQHLWAERGLLTSPFAPVFASGLVGGASGAPWVAFHNGQETAVGMTIGPSSPSINPPNTNIMSTKSPLFGPEMVEQLRANGVNRAWQ